MTLMRRFYEFNHQELMELRRALDKQIILEEEIISRYPCVSSPRLAILTCLFREIFEEISVKYQERYEDFQIAPQEK